MPTLDVSAVARSLGGDVPIVKGRVTVKYLTAPRVPAVTVQGADVTFSPVITVPIVDGAPGETLDVPPTDAACYAEITIESVWPAPSAGRWKSGPVAIPADAVTLDDLIPVNPDTYQPTPLTPSLDAVIQQRIIELTYDRY
ncbi:hypothetical protein [uncultured Microbacterium sp.]|uniref:hypothetical protein n=1 Tax=uncultured Microbacterium sp. TaxID=191216 RepID=UPI00261D6B23|nr:hypothetical protein [uncultured Microbacterium sp.]